MSDTKRQRAARKAAVTRSANAEARRAAAEAEARRSEKEAKDAAKKETLVRRPRRSPSPSPDSRRNRSVSPARRSTVAALTQQLEETKAELQRARDELKEAVRHERIDALMCPGCSEHVRCSWCHECIPCCLEGAIRVCLFLLLFPFL